jgi:hypothetical protein
MRRALGFAAGFLAICFSLSAKDSLRELNDCDVQFASLTLSDAQSFSFPETITPVTVEWGNAQSIVDLALPRLVVRPSQRIATVSPVSAKDVQSEPVSELRKPVFDYAHGEIGVMFGMSASNRFSGDFEQGYLNGTVGNEHLQISAGASYERSSIRRH